MLTMRGTPWLSTQCLEGHGFESHWGFRYFLRSIHAHDLMNITFDLSSVQLKLLASLFLAKGSHYVQHSFHWL